jgi:hypothetical protein
MNEGMVAPPTAPEEPAGQQAEPTDALQRDRVEVIRTRLSTVRIRAGGRELSNRATLVLGGGVGAALVVVLLGSLLMLATGGKTPATAAPVAAASVSAPDAGPSITAVPTPTTSRMPIWTPDPNRTFAPTPTAPDSLPTATETPEATPSDNAGDDPGSADGTVTALIKMPCERGMSESPPAFDSGLVFVECMTPQSSATFAFDISTGRLKHTYEMGGRGRLYVDNGLWYSDRPAGGCVMSCPPYTPNLYRMDIATGTVTFTLAGADVLGAAGGNVWAGTSAGVIRINTSTLAVTTVLAATDGSPVLGCGRIWVESTSSDGMDIYSYDAMTGAPKGSFRSPSSTPLWPEQTPQGCWSIFYGGAGSSGDYFVQLDDTGIVARSPSGAALWLHILDGTFWGTLNWGELVQYDPSSWQIVQTWKKKNGVLLYGGAGYLWVDEWASSDGNTPYFVKTNVKP